MKTVKTCGDETFVWEPFVCSSLGRQTSPKERNNTHRCVNESVGTDFAITQEL